MLSGLNAPSSWPNSNAGTAFFISPDQRVSDISTPRSLPCSFGWWAWRLDRQAPAAPGAHFLPVEITGVGGPDEVTVTPPTDDTRIEIALPDGVTVRVGRGVDGEALHRVLTALGR